ncbi:DUF74-domain-containing protein [Atractiella rhizophila]|nr:DUF74-domain-containing protein [Atractiella rhizophila]
MATNASNFKPTAEDKKEDENFKSLKVAPITFHLQETHGVLISTMNDIPGYKVVQVLGTIYGIAVRSRNVFASVGAGLKSLVGGEIGAYTKMMYSSRNKAVERLIGECIAKKGNAIITMRFDQGNLGPDISQVCAYGTAVIIEKL